MDGLAVRGKTDAHWETDVRGDEVLLRFSIPTPTHRVRTIRAGAQVFAAPLDWPELQGLHLSLNVMGFLMERGVELGPEQEASVSFFEKERCEVWRFDARAARELADGLIAAAEDVEERAARE